MGSGWVQLRLPEQGLEDRTELCEAWGEKLERRSAAGERSRVCVVLCVNRRNGKHRGERLKQLLQTAEEFGY